MQYFGELSLEEGFRVLEKPKEDRLVKGKEVSSASGTLLFHALRGSPIKCYACSIQANTWIATRGKNESQNKKPVLNLYAKLPNPVMFTRDHIIPKSLGGTDDVGNLRPACERCNSTRGNFLTMEDIKFFDAHPEYFNADRFVKGYTMHLKQLVPNSNNPYELLFAQSCRGAQLLALVAKQRPVSPEAVLPQKTEPSEESMLEWILIANPEMIARLTKKQRTLRYVNEGNGVWSGPHVQRKDLKNEHIT